MSFICLKFGSSARFPGSIFTQLAVANLDSRGNQTTSPPWENRHFQYFLEKVKAMKVQSLGRTNSRMRSIVAGLATLAILVGLMLSPMTDLIVSVAAAGVQRSVIIQLKDDPAAVWMAKQKKAGKTVSDAQLATYRASLKAKQDQFLTSLTLRGISYQVSGVDVNDFAGSLAGHVDFRYTMVLNGMSLRVPSSAVSAIRSMATVKRVDANTPLHIELEKSVDYIRAPQVYGQYQELTPFDTFHEGYEGQGMNIAVLDTGIDWTNPMFGGDPTPPRLGILPSIAAVATNQKVIYYMSFTSGLLDDFGHGSHASADIAGYLAPAPGADGLPGGGDDVNLHGVAPQAKLMGYKVCAAVGVCLPESTIMGLEDAVSPVSLTGQPKPIAHVINLSLGGAGGPDDSTAVAADNAALTGTIVVAAAGNDGPVEGSVGSPAAGRHVIAAGANTDPGGGSHTLDLTDGSKTGMLANLMEGSPAITADIAGNYVFCGLAETPADCPASVSGKIALIARGSTYNTPDLPAAGGLGTGLFTNKAASAAASGAVAAIIYNNADGELTATTVRKSTIPVVGLSKANGEYLKSLIGADETAVSPGQVRINAAKVFSPQMADFSSRGPVQGLGQVKPDITAPGVDIYSATARVGGAETNTSTMFDPTGFIHASGTSFSCPHTAGAAALIKQAHLDWTPDMVRTALINTATNLRTQTGTPKSTANSDDIISQGGGLIDVQGAVTTKALMGVAGDGIVQPGILGSYSFGETPILNNRISNTRSVTVTIKDVSGQGGVYDLSTANNRGFDRAGVTAIVSPSSVTVAPGGSSTFTATVTIDGNQVKDDSPFEFQWYVIATGGGKSLHMPMYLKANPSLPDATGGTTQTDTFTGEVLIGDASAQHDQDLYVGESVSYNDVPFTVTPGTVKVDATLGFTEATGDDAALSDLDLYVLDPAGTPIASSTESGGPEHVSVAVSQPGTYTYRVYGWVAANTPYTLTSTQMLGGAPPNVNPIAANFVEQSSGKRYDFDGTFDVTWTGGNGAENFEVERSTDGTNWTTIQQLAGNATGISYNNIADGTYNFRVRSIVAGKIGKFVTIPSNVATIIVSRRAETDATASVDAINRSITFGATTTDLVTALKNKSATVFYPNVRFEITSITSNGNSVTVVNSDNGGNGTMTPAVFDYSQLVGSDFITNEESGNKTLKFNNPNNVLFSFTARVTANVAVGGGTTQSSMSGTGKRGPAMRGETSTSNATTTTTPGARSTVTKVMQFSVDPSTRVVTVTLLR